MPQSRKGRLGFFGVLALIFFFLGSITGGSNSSNSGKSIASQPPEGKKTKVAANGGEPLDTRIGELSVTSESGDWPQFMRNAEKTGDAPDEQLNMPLNLLAQIQLDDAILTSPVVVGGQVYVVDQMGAAYCIDPNRKEIVWKSAPEGDDTFGTNTSSPCVADGKVFYGTIAGNLHILNARNGDRARTISYGWPIMSAITLANDSIYFLTLDGVVHCLDLFGDTRWKWDTYGTQGRSREAAAKNTRDDGKSTAYFATNPVAVSGTKVVVAVADDLLCLEDKGIKAELAWKLFSPVGSVYVTRGAAISGDYVYLPTPGKDGFGRIARFSLEDGSNDKRKEIVSDQWAALDSAAVRDETMYFSRDTFGMTAYDFGAGGPRWTSFSKDPDSITPAISAPALSKDHCLYTTLFGELIAVPLSSRGNGLDSLGTSVFRFETPGGPTTTSSPSISNGRVYFGSDDGCLYVLGSGKAVEPAKSQVAVHKRKSKATVAGKRPYDWPSAYGGPANNNFIDDAGFKPPFKLKYAVRNYGQFKHPVCATEQDVFYVTLGGFVVCREQETGRTRWRRKMLDQVWTRSSVLCADGKVFVARMFSTSYPKLPGQPNTLYCLDGETGEVLWKNPIGIGDRLRASPLYADGVVAFGSFYPPDGSEILAGKRAVVPAGAEWHYLAGSDPQGAWTTVDFDAKDWKTGKAGFGYDDRYHYSYNKTVLDMKDKYPRVYIRKAFQDTELPESHELGLMVRYDDGFIAYLNGVEVVRAAVGEGSGAEAREINSHEAEALEYFPIRNWKGLVKQGVNVLAIEGHNTTLDSSDFTLEPRLVVSTDPSAPPSNTATTGQVVEGWDANTGQRLWRIPFNATSKMEGGPSGCVGDGVMYFTGGKSTGKTGETMAVKPRAGEILWRTDKAYASATGTPAYRDGKLYLSGARGMPITCMSATDGAINWQQVSVVGRHHVETPALGSDYFSVNNKYRGGAWRWNLADGSIVGSLDKPVQLWGPAHGCGAIVLASEGFALSATLEGIYAVDSETGKVIWKSMGIGSHTCPNPAAANGRIYYCPQINGMMFCFEPMKGN